MERLYIFVSLFILYIFVIKYIYLDICNSSRRLSAGSGENHFLDNIKILFHLLSLFIIFKEESSNFWLKNCDPVWYASKILCFLYLDLQSNKI